MQTWNFIQDFCSNIRLEFRRRKLRISVDLMAIRNKTNKKEYGKQTLD